MTTYCPNCGVPVASRHEHAQGVVDLEGWSCEPPEPFHERPALTVVGEIASDHDFHFRRHLERRVRLYAMSDGTVRWQLPDDAEGPDADDSSVQPI